MNTNMLAVANPAFFERNAGWMKLTGLMIFCFVSFLFTGYAHADMFSAGKQEIVNATNSDSTLYLTITVISLAVAVITGLMTKNWFGAIGGFMASMIFIKVGMAMVGIA